MSQPNQSRLPFNWEEAKARMARAAATADDSGNLSQQQAKQIMDERAQKLARTPPQAVDASQVLDLVTFRLGNDRFGIEARYVREMIQLKQITPVPDAPDYLLGTTNLRGEVLAVFDVRDFFDVPRTDPNTRLAGLVLGESRTEFALVVDQVEGVATFRTTDFFDATGAISSSGREWVKGISQSAMVLLDAKTMLIDPHLFVDEA